MKNSELVIMRDNKIMKIKPVDFEKISLNKGNLKKRKNNIRK